MRSAFFALPTFVASAMAAEVFVTWRHEIPSGSTSLTIQSAEKTVLAEVCGSSIGSLDFSNVDQHGAGSFNVGDKKFSIQSQPQAGPVCTRIYNGDIAVVECTGVNLTFDIPAGVAKSADCFLHEHVKAAFLSLKSRSVDIDDATAHEQPEIPPFHSRILGSRQTTCVTNTDVSVMGDGNPHQNFLHKQISGATTSSCYRPDNGKVNQWIIKSPNEKNAGGGYYCVIGTCRSKGDQYWDNSGRAGGP
ncbi:hypothetical protein CC86DRAFT_433967 [Ophiobolus disseminans]|uniref:AA1-like domain-containing protein n=1 Tax=Ophiobolus disseminans TaxID=1469910 RepID=A0A6A7AC59_9PLEO|nr:hypothetical protein CC86DRAFT_433967 [Ophiobolus disseminans]